jgi:hypothetical protein
MDLALVVHHRILVGGLDDRPPLRVDHAGNGEALLPAVTEHVAEQVDHVLVGVIVVVQQHEMVPGRQPCPLLRAPHRAGFDLWHRHIPIMPRQGGAGKRRRSSAVTRFRVAGRPYSVTRDG